MSAAARPLPSSAPKRAPLATTRMLSPAIIFAIVAGIFATLCVLVFLHGWDYYRTPLTERPYQAQHRLLRPSGLAGHLLGVAGTLFLFATLPYVVRKRVKRLAKKGSLPNWLEFHIFCGIFGPILVTLHTAVKFNGIISVAYWSMTLVVISGFMGRYLYVRIPKTIRGEELSQAEVEERARELKARLNESGLPPALIARIEAAEQRLEIRGAFSKLRRRIAAWRASRQLRREIGARGESPHFVDQVLALAHERAVLMSRIARLKKTRALFQTWHVFHRPLVWVMFLVFFVHLGVAIYFGYTTFWSGGAR